MIYLDNCATTPLDPAVAETMLAALRDSHGNPSSIHRAGRAAARMLTEARRTIADSLSARPSEIVFTSSGTEANNLILTGVIEAAVRNSSSAPVHVITSTVEHPSVANRLAWEVRRQPTRLEVSRLPVDSTGRISAEELDRLLSARPDTCLVTLLHCNNETGVLQDLEALREIRLRHPRIPLHLDIVQSYLKTPFDVRTTPVDFLTATAHKLHGPKGIGFAYLREGWNLEPLLVGGAQEKYRRAGTENLAGIVGFAEAVRRSPPAAELHDLLDRLEIAFLRVLRDEQIAFEINGGAYRMSGILNLSFSGVENKEDLLIALDLEDVMVSSTSACHSGVVADSAVLTAMGIAEERRAGSIRIGFSRMNTEEEVTEAARRIARTVRRFHGQT